MTSTVFFLGTMVCGCDVDAIAPGSRATQTARDCERVMRTLARGASGCVVSASYSSPSSCLGPPSPLTPRCHETDLTMDSAQRRGHTTSLYRQVIDKSTTTNFLYKRYPSFVVNGFANTCESQNNRCNESATLRDSPTCTGICQEMDTSTHSESDALAALHSIANCTLTLSA